MHHIDDKTLIDRGLTNYWGYNTIGYFAPEAKYSSSGATGGQVTEFKAMVRNLHAAGIEVILDVVYNHTGGRKSPRADAEFSRRSITWPITDSPGRSAFLQGFHRHGEHLQSASSAHPATGDGQPALLGQRHAR